MKLKKTAGYILFSLLILFALFHLVYRPWNLTWGATDEEVNRSMIGDERVQDPTFNATRAVTINARPEDIWPWLLQIGYKKAGFYSYDFLDNDGIPSSDSIIPEYQDLRVGDRIPLGETGTITVAVLEPYEHILLASQTGGWTWAWGLYRTDLGTTRLVTRLRVRSDNVVTRYLWDAFEIVMMRKCLLGIKERVESSSYPPRSLSALAWASSRRAWAFLSASSMMRCDC